MPHARKVPLLGVPDRQRPTKVSYFETPEEGISSIIRSTVVSIRLHMLTRFTVIVKYYHYIVYEYERLLA